MSVLDSLRQVLAKLTPGATAADILAALNAIGTAEGSQAEAAKTVASAISRIADVVEPPQPPTPVSPELYIMFLEAHPSWNTAEPEGVRAELDLRATLIRYSSTGFSTFTWVEELIEQASTGSFALRLVGADLPAGQFLDDLPTALVASIYGDDLTNGRKTASVFPPTKLDGVNNIQTPWTDNVLYQIDGEAKIQAQIRYVPAVNEYSLTINWNIQPPRG